MGTTPSRNEADDLGDESAMDASIREALASTPRLTYTGHDETPFTFEQLEAAFGGT